MYCLRKRGIDAVDPTERLAASLAKGTLHCRRCSRPPGASPRRHVVVLEAVELAPLRAVPQQDYAARGADRSIRKLLSVRVLSAAWGGGRSGFAEAQGGCVGPFNSRLHGSACAVFSPYGKALLMALTGKRLAFAKAIV